MNIHATESDTIAAIATPPGRGAIAMVRLSGPQAIQIADTVWRGKPLAGAPSHTAHLGFITEPGATAAEQPIDQALATIFRAPRSFTGEDMVEFGLHGSPLIARQTLQALIQAGARPAGPGEFSRRAVANGRMSLIQAEAAADLTAASSTAARRIAMTQMRSGVGETLTKMQDSLLKLASLLELELDFSEEDVEFASRSQLRDLALRARKHLRTLHDSYATGQAIKDGIPVAIAGPTNAGKSSLLNALLGERRAIVSDIHGTTRDIVEDTLEIGDYLFRFMDTAGLRDTSDPIERLGIANSRKALGKARIILLVTDSTQPLPHALIDETRGANPQATLLLIRNKADRLPRMDALNQVPTDPEQGTDPGTQATIMLSAKTGEGLDTLRAHLAQTAAQDETQAGDILLTNARHQACLAQALAALDRTLALLPPTPQPTDQPTKQLTPTPQIAPTPDIIAQSLREVISPLSELTGTALTTPALLSNIFAHFCIGK